jgi:hypothetical protein
MNSHLNRRPGMSFTGRKPSLPLRTLLALAFVPSLLMGQTVAGSVPPEIAPLTVEQKLTSRIWSTIGPWKLAEVAVLAGYDQWSNTPSEWKQGGEAFGKRYASEFGYVVARQTFAFGLEAALHQDPRYFPSRQKGFMKRTGSVVKQTFVARSDSGRNQFAWARMGSAAGASFLGETWQPHSTATTGYAMQTFGFTLAGDAAYNWVQEFFPIFRPKELRHL